MVLLCLSPCFLCFWQHIKFYISTATCLPQGLFVPGLHLLPSLRRQWGRVPLPMPRGLQPRQPQHHSLQAAGEGRRSPKGSSRSVCALEDDSSAPGWAGCQPTVLIAPILASRPCAPSLYLPFPEVMTRCLQPKVN